MASTQQQSTGEAIAKLWQQAQDLQEQGKSDAILEVYRSILELNDRYLPALHQVAQIHESRGEFAEAIEVYQKAIEVDEKPPFWVYRHLGFSLSQNGELEAASEVYRQAIALRLDDVATYNLLGQVRGKLGDFEGAVSSYGKAIELQPEQPSWVYLNFAEALERQGHNDRAIAAYEKALVLEPENQGIQRLLEVVIARKEGSKVDRTERAKELQQQGKLEEALVEYRAVLAQDWSNLAVLHQVAKICESQGKWDEAVEGYRKAVEVDAEPPFWVYRHLGFALSQQGYLDEAIEAYEKAIALNLEDKTAQSLLEQAKHNRKHLLQKPPQLASHFSFGIQLCDIVASGRCVMGYIIASPSESPPFGLSASVTDVEGLTDFPLDISFKKQDITSGYCIKKYSFKILVPLDLFNKARENVFVNILDRSKTCLSKSKLSPLFFKQPFGVIEGRSALKIWGWAWDPMYPSHPVQIQFKKSDRQPKITIANRYRPDLYQAGCGDGCHGFEYVFDSPEDLSSLDCFYIQGETRLQISKNIDLGKTPNNIQFPKFMFRTGDRVTLR